MARSALPYLRMYFVASLIGRFVTPMNWLNAAVNSGEVFDDLDEDVRFDLDCDIVARKVKR